MALPFYIVYTCAISSLILLLKYLGFRLLEHFFIGFLSRPVQLLLSLAGLLECILARWRKHEVSSLFEIQVHTERVEPYLINYTSFLDICQFNKEI